MTHAAAQTASVPLMAVALEQTRPRGRRILDDPLAVEFLPPLARIALAAGGSGPWLGDLGRDGLALVGPGIVCRKRFIADAVGAAGLTQVVNLGSGMDTLTVRLARTGVEVFDIDQPEMIAQRRAAVRASGGVADSHHLIAADLSAASLPEILRAAGHRADVPTFVIAEGLLQYLDAAAVADLLAALRTIAAPGSLLAFSYLRLDFAQGRNLYDAAALYRHFVVEQRLWRFALDPDAVGPWLSGAGWRLFDDAGPAEYRTRYLDPLGRVDQLTPIERMALAVRLGD